MTTLKAVIGASLGDEGKGHMVDYVASKSEKNCIVVCTNGGAQRGHTVVTKRNGEHIFHHFGSGTFAGADTYLPASFIVNPMIFMQEYREIDSYLFNTYINPNALCSTPFDMMINQIIEENRGDNKHGSCGVGIWETILRNGPTYGELISMLDDELRKYLVNIRDVYFLTRIKQKKMDIPKRWVETYFSDGIINHYIWDLRYVASFTKMYDDSILKRYKTVIFENGQGLMLDQNIVDSKHSTPSNTGSKDIRRIVDNAGFCDYKMDVIYVSRTYVTRHGAGELAFENSYKNIGNIKVEDETNVFNTHQGDFRYGVLFYDDLVKRISDDFNTYWKADKNAHLNVAITHLDELIFPIPALHKALNYDKIYLSRGRYREDIFEDVPAIKYGDT